MARWKRVQIMSIAKCIRNAPISEYGRKNLAQQFCDIFRASDPLFAEKQFRAIVYGGEEDDLPQFKGVKKNGN